MTNDDNIRGIWRVGDAVAPSPGDKTFEWLRDALDHARLSSSRNRNLAVAVWDHDEIDYLYLNGSVFRRVS